MRAPAPFDPRFRCRASVNSPAGFTLLEVVVATCVMAFGIATSIITIQAGYRHLDLARGITMTSQILQSEMERVRMMSFNSVLAMAGQAPATFDGATHFTSNPRVRDKYAVTRTVVADSARPTQIVTVTVTATWRTIDGRPHTRTTSGVFAKNGLYDYYYTLANR